MIILKKTIMAKAIIRHVVYKCDEVELSYMYWFDEGWGNGSIISRICGLTCNSRLVLYRKINTGQVRNCDIFVHNDN